VRIFIIALFNKYIRLIESKREQDGGCAALLGQIKKHTILIGKRERKRQLGVQVVKGDNIKMYLQEV
jgi:hypothetical protein